ncbi:hypothetical protein DYB25_001748 [Aphanomyces astaci]|uniref:U4/U6.U5 small nuclear ribonucleoprotein 27kDa protein domain-containing protein n=1 Tax=Aphanomyces astaci TaxID=112090 RepID=A0A397BB22_APHAT|nr:hypothetical protein DYB25_001748 [Aphanomyces astaci]
MGRRSRSRSGSLDSWGRKRVRSSRAERSDRDVRDRDVRDRDRRRSRERGRSRSRSRERILQGEGGSSPSNASQNKPPEPEISEEEQMRLLMGFGGFDTTKGKVVEENLRGPALGTSNTKSKREYRQFMNKRSSFMKPKPPAPMNC